MRNLNTADLLKTVTIAGKIGFKAKDAFKVKEGEEVSSLGIGMTFFSVAMEYAEKDLKELLASIAEMSVEEFDKMPFDYSLEVIEHIAETEDLAGFLQRVTHLTRKLSKKSPTE